MLEPQRWRYALVRGVLQWGLPMALFFTVFMALTTDTPVAIQFPVALVLFTLGGLAIGLATWTPPAPESPPAAPETGGRAERGGTDDEVEAGTAFVAVVMWGNIVLFGSAMVLSLILGSYGLALAFLGLVAVHLLGLSICARVRITGEAVELSNWWRRYRVRWPDIRKYEVDHQGTNYALITDGGVLPLPSLGLWSGREKARARQLFRDQLERHGIPGETNKRVQLRLRPRGVETV